MFDYKIIRSHRRTIGIIVSAGPSVTVRAPYRTSDPEIRRFVESKRGWIEKHLSAFEGMTNLNGKGYRNGESIMFRGREYVISIIPSEKNSVRMADGVIEVMTSRPGDMNIIQAFVERWYRVNAEVILKQKLREIVVKHQAMNFRPSVLRVRKLKRKWGSCTSKGAITLNSDLIKLDDSLQEYVIIHELCHLFHPNHGKEFYNLLGTLVPEWQELRRRLRQYLS